MRAKLCTRAMFPSVSVVRSITSVNAFNLLLLLVFADHDCDHTAKVAQSTMRRRP
jgi:hypothetical protein